MITLKWWTINIISHKNVDDYSWTNAEFGANIFLMCVYCACVVIEYCSHWQCISQILKQEVINGVMQGCWETRQQLCCKIRSLDLHSQPLSVILFLSDSKQVLSKLEYVYISIGLSSKWTGWQLSYMCVNTHLQFTYEFLKWCKKIF